MRYSKTPSVLIVKFHYLNLSLFPLAFHIPVLVSPPGQFVLYVADMVAGMEITNFPS